MFHWEQPALLLIFPPSGTLSCIRSPEFLEAVFTGIVVVPVGGSVRIYITKAEIRLIGWGRNGTAIRHAHGVRALGTANREAEVAPFWAPGKAGTVRTRR